MVFDTQTLKSFSDLAGVIGGYTTPGRLTTPLTQDQKRDACLMRYTHNWHAHHIAEALGILEAKTARHAEEDILEALEECALSDYWNRQQVRLQPGVQISVAGGSTYAAFRTSAIKDAMARLLITNPKLSTKDLGEAVNRDIDRQIDSGQFLGQKPFIPGVNELAGWIRELEAEGFVWEGRRRGEGVAGLPEDVRTLVDAEILRQCAEAQIAGTLNYAQIAKDVYSKFVLDEEFGDTLESLRYDVIRTSYVGALCRVEGVTTGITMKPVAEQAADPKLIAEVKRLKAANPNWSNLRVATEMGTHAGVTAAIFNSLGLPLNPRGMRPKDLRELVLKAHNEEKLSVNQMIEKYPQIGTYFATGSVKVRDAVVRLLSRAGLTPYTEEAVIVQQTQERRTPLVAAEIRRIIIDWLRNPKLQEQNPAFGQNLLLRIPDNARIAQLTGESESLISDAIGLLLAEERPIIQLLEGIVQAPPHVQLRAKRGELS
jgi:hypothetical protein